MTAGGFTLFETAIGRCGIAWGANGVRAVQLPDATDDATRRRLRKLQPDAVETTPPVEVKQAIAAIVALLDGQSSDLARVTLDMGDIPDFHRRVYDVARTIPPGATLTYGDIATRLGEPRAAREVGQALGRNPFPIIVPCHRVLAAGGNIGGFSAPGGVSTKRRMLAIEGVHVGIQPALFDG